MSPLFRKATTALPDQSAITPAQVAKWWDYWVIWRLVKCDLPSFVIMTAWKGPLPKDMIDVFLELDNYHARMEAQKLKEETAKGKHG